jgi:hypothetical protein
MSTTASDPATSTAHEPGAAGPRGTRRRATRIGQGILIVLSAMCAVIGASTLVADDPFEPAATTMIASFGMLAGAFGIGAALAAPRSLPARLSLCALPVFFAWHVAALGTWVPDAVLGVVSVVGVVLVVVGSRGGAGPVS